MTQIISELNKLSSKDIYFVKMVVWLICLIQTLSYAVAEFRRGGQICPTITTGSCNIYKIERDESMNVKDWAIRKLNPTECWRLMGFTDEDVAKCKAVGMSDTQLYRQAGNSIITNCIELLAEHLYKSQYDENYKCFDENFQ